MPIPLSVHFFWGVGGVYLGYLVDLDAKTSFIGILGDIEEIIIDDVAFLEKFQPYIHLRIDPSDAVKKVSPSRAARHPKDWMSSRRPLNGHTFRG